MILRRCCFFGRVEVDVVEVEVGVVITEVVGVVGGVGNLVNDADEDEEKAEEGGDIEPCN